MFSSRWRRAAAAAALALTAALSGAVGAAAIPTDAHGTHDSTDHAATRGPLWTVFKVS